MLTLSLLSLTIGVAVLVLPWRPWATSESLDAGPAAVAEADLADVTVLIPARNEASVLAGTLRALAAQGRNLSVVLVDDQSGDDTVAVARASGIERLRIVAGQALPGGWSGKLWALEQGRTRVHTPYTLLLDADIVLAPGMIATLRDKLHRDGLQLVSLMAHLGMQNFWECLLLPAFVYFFKLLYPFSLSNSPRSRVAAAAGGCILVKSDWLLRIGGFAALKGALIDDCTLAARVKAAGGRTWIGLTHSALSQRRYDLAAVWNMVARTAYAQLRYSLPLLLACTALMGIYYVVPLAGLLAGDGAGRVLALAAYAAAIVAFLPTLVYYRLSPGAALLLPLIAALYLAMTWTSALRYFRGERSRWKERTYGRDS